MIDPNLNPVSVQSLVLLKIPRLTLPSENWGPKRFLSALLKIEGYTGFFQSKVRAPFLSFLQGLAVATAAFTCLFEALHGLESWDYVMAIPLGPQLS